VFLAAARNTGRPMSPDTALGAMDCRATHRDAVRVDLIRLRSHLGDFVSAYNFVRRLKTLKGLTPYKFICKTWLKEPKRFKFDPVDQMLGLNI
jgi:hypothetical protein